MNEKIDAQILLGTLSTLRIWTDYNKIQFSHEKDFKNAGKKYGIFLIKEGNVYKKYEYNLEENSENNNKKTFKELQNKEVICIEATQFVKYLDALSKYKGSIVTDTRSRIQKEVWPQKSKKSEKSIIERFNVSTDLDVNGRVSKQDLFRAPHHYIIDRQDGQVYKKDFKKWTYVNEKGENFIAKETSSFKLTYAHEDRMEEITKDLRKKFKIRFFAYIAHNDIRANMVHIIHPEADAIRIFGGGDYIREADNIFYNEKGSPLHIGNEDRYFEVHDPKLKKKREEIQSQQKKEQEKIQSQQKIELKRLQKEQEFNKKYTPKWFKAEKALTATDIPQTIPNMPKMIWYNKMPYKLMSYKTINGPDIRVYETNADSKKSLLTLKPGETVSYWQKKDIPKKDIPAK